MSTEACLVGVGGAGGRIVDRAAEIGRDGILVTAINTDAAELNELRFASALRIGAARTRGAGSGGKPGIARRAAEEDADEIRKIFREPRIALVVAGLGGGTGAGAAPVVLRSARDAGALTICVATLPFGFEGEARMRQAQELLPDLRTAADAIVVMPNDRLFASTGETGVPEAFEKAAHILAEAVCALLNMVVKPGYINLDIADVRSIVDGSEGTCGLGYGTGKGKHRARNAVSALLDGPLLEQGQVLANAKAVLLSIAGGPGLTLADVGSIMAAVGERCSRECHIAMGTVVDERMKDSIGITAIVAERWSLAPGEEAPPPDSQGRSGRRRKRPVKDMQTQLALETSGKGRFKGVEPTMMDGEDLDTPTFLRRNMRIEK